jgi:hypothetical protein
VAAGDLEKTASEDPNEVRNKRSADFLKLSHDSRQLEGELEILHIAFVPKLHDLKGLCKTASNEGWTPMVVGAAIEWGTSAAGLKRVIAKELGDLVEFGGQEKIAEAGYAPMPQNPVTGLVTDLDMLSQKMMAASSALEQTRAGMSSLLMILQGGEGPPPAAEPFMGGAAGATPAPPPPGPSAMPAPPPGPPAGPPPGAPAGPPMGP